AAAPAIPATPIAIQRSPAPALLQLSRVVMSCAPKDQIAVLAQPIRKVAKIRCQSTPVSDGAPSALFLALVVPPGMLNTATKARPMATAAKPTNARRH